MFYCHVFFSRTPNILNKDPTDKKDKNEKSPVSLKHEFDPTGKKHTDLDPTQLKSEVFYFSFVTLLLTIKQV